MFSSYFGWKMEEGMCYYVDYMIQWIEIDDVLYPVIDFNTLFSSKAERFLTPCMCEVESLDLPSSFCRPYCVSSFPFPCK